MSTLKLKDLTVDQVVRALSKLPDRCQWAARLVDVLWQPQLAFFRDAIDWWLQQKHDAGEQDPDILVMTRHGQWVAQITPQSSNPDALYTVEVALPHNDDDLIAQLVEAAR